MWYLLLPAPPLKSRDTEFRDLALALGTGVERRGKENARGEAVPSEAGEKEAKKAQAYGVERRNGSSPMWGGRPTPGPPQARRK